jgi:hypothetical protein
LIVQPGRPTPRRHPLAGKRVTLRIDTQLIHVITDGVLTGTRRARSRTTHPRTYIKEVNRTRASGHITTKSRTGGKHHPITKRRPSTEVAQTMVLARLENVHAVVLPYRCPAIV